MTIEESIKILDPTTSAQTIAEIDYYSGFNRNKSIEKVNEACVVACSVMRMYQNSVSKKRNDMEWNVYYHDFNAKKIIHLNIFRHGSFLTEVCNLLDSDNLTKEEFAKQLERILLCYYWSKCEYEIVISPWVGKADDIKVDIYAQVMTNWDRFVDYVWSFKENNG